MVPDGASFRLRMRSRRAARPPRYGRHEVNATTRSPSRQTKTSASSSDSSEKRPRLKPISPSRFSASHSSEISSSCSSMAGSGAVARS